MTMQSEGDFPQFCASVRLGAKDAESALPIFDVQFCPYDGTNVDPVFAAVYGRKVIIGRLRDNVEEPLELLNIIEDTDENVSLNSLAWSLDPGTDSPLLCIAGSGSKDIKVINPLNSKLVRTISGHGGDINDLVVSPRSPELLASCSADYTIRLWTLQAQYQVQPCTAILSGEGHKQPILALDFHSSGKYLLSGGQDTMVCLWAVPDIPSQNTGTDKSELLHYPYFATSEVHSDYVDCIKFWGDLILSRACGGTTNRKRDAGKDAEEVDFKRNDILLWKIDGFNSNDPLPSSPPMPINAGYTRSAFGGRFQRLLTFEMAPATPFYMRFGIFDKPGHHPMLAMGNELSEYSFWDLQRLEEGYEPGGDEGPKSRKGKRGKPARETAFSGIGANLGREESTVSTTSSTRASFISDPSSAPSDLKFDIADPYKPIAAHKAVTVQCRLNFACRQVAWSNCGKWCIAVGDYAMMAIFKRWK